MNTGKWQHFLEAQSRLYGKRIFTVTELAHVTGASPTVLNVELARVREGDPTPGMLSMLELDRPSIDWVKLAEGMGVPAVAVSSAEDFDAEFARAMAEQGPRLIEASIAQDLQPVVDLIMMQRQQG